MEAIVYISLYFIGVIITDILNKIFFEDKVIAFFECGVCEDVYYDDEDERHIKLLKQYSLTLSIFWPIYLFVLSVITTLAFICESITKISDLTVEKIKEKVNKNE